MLDMMGLVSNVAQWADIERKKWGHKFDHVLTVRLSSGNLTVIGQENVERYLWAEHFVYVVWERP